MNKQDFLQAIQSKTARVAVGASTVRGRGNKGSVLAARTFFQTLDLSSFGKNHSEFKRILDRKTYILMKVLPRGARHWGIARKLLNIFLRDCFYNIYLEDAYKLSRYEKVLEIPLDSITGKSIKNLVGRGALPTWPGVKHVTPYLNTLYQTVALDEAEKQKTSRIHLDAVWWSQNRDE